MYQSSGVKFERKTTVLLLSNKLVVTSGFGGKCKVIMYLLNLLICEQTCHILVWLPNPLKSTTSQCVRNLRFLPELHHVADAP